MELTIQHFRCWESASYSFPEEAVILIRGRSGSGKSTLLKAIVWALYGYGKKVAPFSSPDAKTSVSLTINGLHILRERRPNHLTVQMADDLYHDDAAQACIDRGFGTLDMFMASCYIEQNQRNSFFTMSKSERLSFLDDLVFHDEKPDTYISKLKETRSNDEKEYSTRLIRYEVDLEHHNQHATAVEAETSNRHGMSVAELLSMEDDVVVAVAELSTKKAELKDKLEKRERTSIEIAVIERDIVVVSEPSCPSLLTSMDRGQIEQLAKSEHIADKLLELSSTQTHISEPECPSLFASMDMGQIEQLAKNESLAGRLAKLNHVQIDESSLHLDVEEVRRVEALRSTNEKLCKTLSLAYTKNNVEDVLASIRNQSYPQRLELEEELRTLKEPVQPADEGDLELLLTKAREEVVELERRTCVMACPHCGGSLVLGSVGKLEPCCSKPILPSEKEKLASLKKDVASLERRIAERKKQLAAYRTANDKYIKRRAELDTRLSALKDVEKPKHKLPPNVDYRSLTYYESPPVTSQQLSLMLEKRALLETTTTMGPLDELVPRIRAARPYLLSVKAYRQKQAEMHENRRKIEALLKEIQPPVPVDEFHIRDTVARIRAARSYLLAINDYEKKEKEMCKKRQRVDLLRASLPEDVSHEYKVCCDTLKAKNGLLEAIKSLKSKLATIQRREDTLNEEADKLSVLNAKIRHLSTLLDRAEELEATMIEETVSALSLCINDVAGVLFDVPIDMALSVHKTLKKKERRIAPNFIISYRGNEYNSPSEMSGGEEERCSLAFTLAMHHFSPAPILLLDECLNSLDNRCKETAIDTIRRRTGGICLCVMHGDVDYMYDSVVSVGE
jgi:DNA repair exonuclease SbcCD ATPase subunit